MKALHREAQPALHQGEAPSLEPNHEGGGKRNLLVSEGGHSLPPPTPPLQDVVGPSGNRAPFPSAGTFGHCDAAVTSGPHPGKAISSYLK